MKKHAFTALLLAGALTMLPLTASADNSTNVTVITEHSESQTAVMAVSYTAEAIDLSAAVITLNAESYVYTGSEVCPKIKSVTLEVDGVQTTLREGTDYTVTYENNTNVTTPDDPAKVILTGIGWYTGTAEQTYQIVQPETTTTETTTVTESTTTASETNTRPATESTTTASETNTRPATESTTTASETNTRPATESTTTASETNTKPVTESTTTASETNTKPVTESTTTGSETTTTATETTTTGSETTTTATETTTTGSETTTTATETTTETTTTEHKKSEEIITIDVVNSIVVRMSDYPNMTIEDVYYDEDEAIVEYDEETGEFTVQITDPYGEVTITLVDKDTGAEHKVIIRSTYAEQPCHIEYKTEETRKYYFSEDENVFDPADLITKLLRKVIAEDGTESDWAEVTDLSGLDLKGQTPKSLYDAQDAPYCKVNPTAQITAVLPNGETDVQTITLGQAWIGIRGDANLDGEVNARDATKVFQYAAAFGVGKTPVLYNGDEEDMEEFNWFLADCNLDKELNSRDGTADLIYSTKSANGKDPKWDEILHTQKE